MTSHPVWCARADNERDEHDGVTYHGSALRPLLPQVNAQLCCQDDDEPVLCLAASLDEPLTVQQARQLAAGLLALAAEGEDTTDAAFTAPASSRRSSKSG